MSVSPYRAGPWPGLTPRGGAILLGCAALLALGATLAGSPRRPLPDLPILAVISLVPLALAARITCVPGAGSAVCGAYLLPSTLLSLVAHDMEPPPLLLVPALAFDLGLWLRAADLAALGNVWPRRRRQWRKRRSRLRVVSRQRAAAAGALYGAALAAIVPPWAAFLGGVEGPAGDASVWSGATYALGSASAIVSSAVIAAALSDRGRGS